MVQGCFDLATLVENGLEGSRHDDPSEVRTEHTHCLRMVDTLCAWPIADPVRFVGLVQHRAAIVTTFCANRDVRG